MLSKIKKIVVITIIFALTLLNVQLVNLKEVYAEENPTPPIENSDQLNEARKQN